MPQETPPPALRATPSRKGRGMKTINLSPSIYGRGWREAPGEGSAP